MIVPAPQSVCGPIGSLCCSDEHEAVFFSISNELRIVKAAHSASPSMVMRTPDGSVITQISVSSDVIVVSAADTIFAAHLSTANMTTATLHPILSMKGHRVIRIAYDALTASFVVVSAGNTVCVVSNSDILVSLATQTLVSRGGSGVPLAHFCGPKAAVVLAADAIIANSVCYVFSATYDGTVTPWSFCVSGTDEDDNNGVTTYAAIPSHRGGCAVFSVKALGFADSFGFYVATCSDDRTATLFHSPTMTSPEWGLVWRGSGTQFSRCRVFDVSIRLDAVRRTLLYGVGSEDGSIYVAEIPISSTGHGKPVCWSRSDQHGGHGTCRVSFLQSPQLSENPWLISAGFDGTVCGTFWRGENAHIKIAVNSNNNSDAANAKSIKRQVRVVHVDEKGNLLFCTESELCVSDVPNTRGTPSRYNLQDVVDSAVSASDANASKRIRPTCLTTISFLDRAVATVGTEGGGAFLMPYREDIGNSVHSGAWAEHRKVLAVEAAVASSRQAVLISCHADNAVLISTVDVMLSGICVVASCSGSLGLLSTALRIIPTGESSGWALIGDKSGMLRGYEYNLTDSVGGVIAMEPSFEAQLFDPSLSIAALHVNLGTSSSLSSITAVSIDGLYCETSLAALQAQASKKGASRLMNRVPLRFPHSLSTCIAVSSNYWVAQYGTSVSVYRRSPLTHSWRKVAAYLNVKAPRLITAAIMEEDSSNESGVASRVVLSHCSDGDHVEVHAFHASGRLSHGDTSILHGGVIPGKDFNCTLALPPPFSCFVHGNEDSSLVVQASQNVRHPRHTPATLVGPHESNILAMALVSATADGMCRLVTVGGLASIAIWEWSLPVGWRVVVSQTDVDSRRVGGCRRKVNSSNTADCVPRYLSVYKTQLGQFFVGGSDGILRVFQHSADGNELSNVAAQVLNTECPKPMMAICGVSPPAHSPSQSCVAVGDTNGQLYIAVAAGDHHEGTANVSAMVVVAQRRIEQSSINAVTSATAQSTSATYIVTMHDSSTVHLLQLMRADDSDSTELVGLAAVCTGLTAGRGLAWPRFDGPLYAVNDERISRLRVFLQESSQAATMAVVRERRVNVRGVSGVSVISSEGGSMGEDGQELCDIAVVGQGVDQFSF